MGWYESLVPFGIIAGAICAMGASQYAAQMFFHGKPKHIGSDNWDRRLELRDAWLAAVIEQEKQVATQIGCLMGLQGYYSGSPHWGVDSLQPLDPQEPCINTKLYLDKISCLSMCSELPESFQISRCGRMFKKESNVVGNLSTNWICAICRNEAKAFLWARIQSYQSFSGTNLGVVYVCHQKVPILIVFFKLQALIMCVCRQLIHLCTRPPSLVSRITKRLHQPCWRVQGNLTNPICLNHNCHQLMVCLPSASSPLNNLDHSVSFRWLKINPTSFWFYAWGYKVLRTNMYI